MLCAELESSALLKGVCPAIRLANAGGERLGIVSVLLCLNVEIHPRAHVALIVDAKAVWLFLPWFSDLLVFVLGVQGPCLLAARLVELCKVMLSLSTDRIPTSSYQYVLSRGVPTFWPTKLPVQRHSSVRCLSEELLALFSWHHFEEIARDRESNAILPAVRQSSKQRSEADAPRKIDRSRRSRLDLTHNSTSYLGRREELLDVGGFK